MVLAAVGGTGYKIMLLLHILTAIVGFAPAWLWPILVRMSGRGDAEAADAIETSILRYSLPGVALAGLFGFGLSGMSDKAFKMSQGWLSVSVVLWLAILAVYLFVARPAIEGVRAGDESARGKLAAATGISHFVLVIMLYLMIFKPGL